VKDLKKILKLEEVVVEVQRRIDFPITVEDVLSVDGVSGERITSSQIEKITRAILFSNIGNKKKRLDLKVGVSNAGLKNPPVWTKRLLSRQDFREDILRMRQIIGYKHLKNPTKVNQNLLFFFRKRHSAPKKQQDGYAKGLGVIVNKYQLTQYPDAESVLNALVALGIFAPSSSIAIKVNKSGTITIKLPPQASKTELMKTIRSLDLPLCQKRDRSDDENAFLWRLKQENASTQKAIQLFKRRFGKTLTQGALRKRMHDYKNRI